MTAPRFSIVIPSHNRVEKLRRALNSISNQNYRDFDVWLVDDGSTDETSGFLKSAELQRMFPEPGRLNILINGTALGAAAARNRALSELSGELIAFLDDDDVWLPDYLRWQLDQFEKHSAASACCARHVECDAQGNTFIPVFIPVLEYENPLVQLLAEPFVHTMSVFVCRRSVLKAAGLLDEHYRIIHDWVWYVQLLLAGGSIITPDGPALVQREVPGGLVNHYREWYSEEVEFLNQVLTRNPFTFVKRRQIRAHRALLFARIGLYAGDYVFSLHRLWEAFIQAPIKTLNIIVIRTIRYFQRNRKR